ncbi:MULTISPECIES: hypothetical protein [Paracoccaceae]|jgi:hypothetical protein|uniref:hypothetical protein n=1 Tax=Rhodobacterales TaxID=204455 RepID=UPI0018F4FCCA|nr:MULTISPECIES: hypothetical protein [Paracoccaceae]MBO6605152.1 hypothetical protein [Roseicyclus sp.]MBO6624734.1 hypothetical protein [Roseicyclus sp.]MBO6923412.1 hypothetical protein [Roseicyclus sp.]
MKAFLASVVVGIVIAVAASFVLNDNFQTDSHSAFATEGARVGTPGDNLINY